MSECPKCPLLRLAETFRNSIISVVGKCGDKKFFHQGGPKMSLRKSYIVEGYEVPFREAVKKIYFFLKHPPKRPLKNLIYRGTTNIASLLEIKMSKIVEAYMAVT